MCHHFEGNGLSLFLFYTCSEESYFDAFLLDKEETNFLCCEGCHVCGKLMFIDLYRNICLVVNCEFIFSHRWNGEENDVGVLGESKGKGRKGREGHILSTSYNSYFKTIADMRCGCEVP